MENRIHPATVRKRQQARARGHIAKSSDLTGAALLGGMMLAFLVTGHNFADYLEETARQHLSTPSLTKLTPNGWFELLQNHLVPLATLLLPVLLFLLLLPLGVHLIQTRFHIHPARTVPDWSRIGPANGFQRIFSADNTVRAGFGLVKLLAIGTVVLWGLYARRTDIVALSTMSIGDLTGALIDILFGIMLEATAALLILAVFDFFYQRRKYERELMMSTEELREEMRDQRPNARATFPVGKNSNR